MEEEINTVEAKNVAHLEEHIRNLEADKILLDELVFTQKPLDKDNVSDWWIVENTDLGVTYDSVVLRHLIQEGRHPKFEVSLDEGVGMMKDGTGKGKLIKDDPYPF